MSSPPDTFAASFRLPYYLSIVSGTMPIYLKMCSANAHWGIQAFKIKPQFAPLTTIAWITIVSIFLIKDLKWVSRLDPTAFFSSKIVDFIPNDYYCLRLLRNLEVWMMLLIALSISNKMLPGLIEKLERYEKDRIVRLQTCQYRKRLMDTHRNLIGFYISIMIGPFILYPYLFYPKQEFDFQRLMQASLHCIPLSVNLQFSSLCNIFTDEFRHLNELMRTVEGSGRSTFSAVRIRDIDHSHAVICSLVRRGRKTFQVQMMLETSFVTLNILLYTFHLLNTDTHQLPHLGDILHDLFWVATFAGRLFTTCILASNVSAEAGKTSQFASLLQDALHQTSDDREEIRSLVIRANNQDINFTICGFFTMDENLIITVCCWCASFILILLQFRTPT